MYARSLLAGRWFAGLLLALAGLTAHASLDYESGYRWSRYENPRTVYFNTAIEACIYYMQADQTYRRGSYWPNWTNGNPRVSAFVTTTPESMCTWDRDSAGDGTFEDIQNQGLARTSCTVGVDCPDPPPPPECEAFPSGEKHLAVASDKPDTYVPPDSICASNCELIRVPNKYQRLGPSGDRELLVTYQSTGLACETDTGEAVSPADTETCVGDWCRSVNTGENCGYHNDQYVCLDKVSPDRCYKNPDGSMLCAEAAPMPPKPDSGTAGEPATPDQTIEACTGENSCQTIQYFNSTSVAGSSRPVPDGAGPSGSGAIDGEGPVTESEESQGSASGGLGCDAAPACDGDPISCAILAQQWRTRCVESPSDGDLEAALGPIEGDDGELFASATFEAATSFNSAGWMGGASCLADYSLNLGSLLGTVEIPFSEWCWLLEVIGVFVMIGAYMSAARIIIGGI